MTAPIWVSRKGEKDEEGYVVLEDRASKFSLAKLAILHSHFVGFRMKTLQDKLRNVVYHVP